MTPDAPSLSPLRPSSTICAVGHAHRGARAGDRRVVGDHHQRQPAARSCSSSSSITSSAERAVEVAGRLVGQQQPTAHHHGAGDRHALALAARELVGAVVGALAQPDRRRAPAPPARGARPRATPAKSIGSSTLPSAVEPRQQVEELEDEADAVAAAAASARSLRQPADLAPVEAVGARASAGRGSRGRAAASTCPSPTGPMTATCSPARIGSDTSLRACTSPSPTR